MTPTTEKPPDAPQPPAQDLPAYQCNRQVRAIKIKRVILRPSKDGAPDVILEPEDDQHGSFVVSAEYLSRCRPCAGMYYVKHADGFESVAPANVFERDHTKI